MRSVGRRELGAGPKYHDYVASALRIPAFADGASMRWDDLNPFATKHLVLSTPLSAEECQARLKSQLRPRYWRRGEATHTGLLAGHQDDERGAAKDLEVTGGALGDDGTQRALYLGMLLPQVTG